MKIAVLMSTYNGHKFLDKQLKSIAEQTLIDSLELYIRDDGSSDDTFEIIDGWKEKIDIVLFKGENIGPAKSFWMLLMDTNIQADYYAFCDQDDIWDRDKLEKAIKKLNKLIDVPSLWCSNCRLIDADDNIVDHSMNKNEPTFDIPSQFVCGTTQGCAIVFNDKLRKKILDKQFSGKPMHDFVVLTNAIVIGEIVYDQVPTFSYRIHGNNVVAKSGKSIIARINASFRRWFSKEHRFEFSKYAKELMEKYKADIECDSQIFLKKILKSSKSIKAKKWLIKHSKGKTNNTSALKSFRLRVLLGIF